ncbi:hypothetical protein [Devosia sp.]|uniref:hypothetical protein n=1 Tax=Devosia sp. TaxID=1871048 RepID=UPI00263982B8|nr:hypothetical protein [Devosia sp.]
MNKAMNAASDLKRKWGILNVASKKQSETLTGGPDAQTTVSVFDFIYHDAPRVASFLAQFDSSGHLTQIAQSAHITRVRDEGDKTTGTLGIVSGETTKAASDEFGKESQRVYDPTWANARVLLDYLDEAGKIQRDISKAQIGQFVLASGSLSLSDLRLMEKTWRLPSVKKLMTNGAESQNKLPPIAKGQRNNSELLLARKAAEEAQKAVQGGIDLFFDLITILPHTIQARLSGNTPTWCSLSREGMTFEASDIVLKYGAEIPGEWNILGILDAQPDTPGQSGEVDWGQGEEIAAKMVGIIAPITRNMLGRPGYCYGVTPLLVFRVVAD